MNITIDNYEAYLLDYMEGNLGPDEAGQLKAFVAAQGLDWDELTEPMPYLEAPEVTYEGKEGLKQRSLSLSKGRSSDKTKVIPLYVKIASAAAAAGLLLTVGLWPEKSLPKVEPIAELKPIQGHVTLNEEPMRLVPRRTIQFVDVQPVKNQTVEKQASPKAVAERVEALAVAELPPMKPQEVSALAVAEPDTQWEMEMLRYRLETDLAMAQLATEPSFDEEMPTNFISRAIYRWSEGRYSSINDLVNAGLHRTKQEIATVTTEIAMEAQQRAEEHLADAREYWREKTENTK